MTTKRALVAISSTTETVSIDGKPVLLNEKVSPNHVVGLLYTNGRWTHARTWSAHKRGSQNAFLKKGLC